MLANLEPVRNAIRTLVAKIVARWRTDSVVADVLATPNAEARLIELNPWGQATCGALYSWHPQDFDGGIRVRTVAAAPQPLWVRCGAPRQAVTQRDQSPVKGRTCTACAADAGAHLEAG